MRRGPEPAGKDGSCRQAPVGWEHPSPRASQIAAIRFVSVAGVTVKDIQFEPNSQECGTWPSPFLPD